jgi:hypothetical protein
MSDEKKPVKKPAKIVKKAAAAKPDGGVSLKDLAKEAKLTGSNARAKLRAAGLKPDGRWSFKKGSGDLSKARKALGL